MGRRLAAVKIALGAFVTLSLAVVAIYSLRGAWSLNERLRIALVAQRVAEQVDFSVVGEIIVPVHVKRDLVHAPLLYLDVPGQPALTRPNLLDEIRGKITTVDASGTPSPGAQDISSNPGAGFGEARRMYFIGMLMVEEGDHTVHIRVDRPSRRWPVCRSSSICSRATAAWKSS